MKWIRIFDSNGSGPTTLVVGLMHGDEIVWKSAIDYLHQKLKGLEHMCGRIISLIGNPDAYEIRKRFIDSDLNRVFDKRSDIENREIKRAQEIKKFFDGIKIDYIFDIHSTSTRSDPMILCTSQEGSKELAKKMPIKKVVHGLIDIVEGEWMIKHYEESVKIGMAFECGFHEDEGIVATGRSIIDTIIDFHQGEKMKDHDEQEHIRISKVVYTSDPQFEFRRQYKGFEVVEEGEIWWEDRHWEYRCENSQVIVMPNAKIAEQLKKQNTAKIAYFWEKL